MGSSPDPLPPSGVSPSGFLTKPGQCLHCLKAQGSGADHVGSPGKSLDGSGGPGRVAPACLFPILGF